MQTYSQLRNAMVIGGLALSAVGCSAENGAATEAPAPSASSSLSAKSGKAVQALGIHSYEVSVDAETTTVELFGAHGEPAGELVSSSSGGAHQVYFTRGSAVLQYVYENGEVSVFVNGGLRGSMMTSAKQLEPSNRIDIAGAEKEFLELQVLATDPERISIVDKARANAKVDVPYMFGVPDCPWWVWLSSCAAGETGVGSLLCAACAIAWL